MDCEFREYQETDYDELLKLVGEELTAAGEQPDKEEVARLFGEDLDPRRDVIRIMTDPKGKLAGWYRYGPWIQQTENYGRAVHLFDIALRKKFRGKGLGRALYQHFEAGVSERGFKRIYSNTLIGNAEAEAFHERAGFSVFKREERNTVWVKGLA
jgi:GNAT superfamily N-acetyltransferase